MVLSYSKVQGYCLAGLAEFEKLAADLVNPSGYEFIEEFDNKTREKVICLRLRKPIPPRIKLVAYYLLNNLKHALDQALGDAALQCGRQDAKGIHFPIGKSPNDLKSEIKRRCGNVHPDLITFIEALNVCQTGNPRLYAVLSLAGPNKHRRIISLRPRNEIRVPNWNPALVGGRVTLGASRWVASQNKVELVRIGEGGYFNHDLQVSLGVFLGNGQPPPRRSGAYPHPRSHARN